MVVKEFKNSLQLKNYKNQVMAINQSYKELQQRFEKIDEETKNLSINDDLMSKSKIYTSELDDIKDKLEFFTKNNELKDKCRIRMITNQQSLKREIIQTVKNSVRIQFPQNDQNFLKQFDNYFTTKLQSDSNTGFVMKKENILNSDIQKMTPGLLSTRRTHKLMGKNNTTSVLKEIELRISDQIHYAVAENEQTTKQFDLEMLLHNRNNKYKGEMEQLAGTSELIKSGIGEMQYYDGSNYIGEWHIDKKHGHGTYISNAKDKYMGQWFDDMKQGKGKIEYQDGKIYEGDWKFDLQNGNGTMRDPDGYYYEGQWMQGLPHGQGFAFFKDGSRYTGTFVQGDRSGFGVNTFKDGAEYEGEWFKDKMQGQGTFKYNDGKIYIGKFENGHKHGRGELTKLDGKIIEGDWINDALVKIIREISN
ncbi:UNKNOWN [Stylonychia lemnae]|uniref:Morn repeat protein n=1 Tax=Stylonychia lemnae TaxID=5949 RepID=A0A078BCS2_STYLE|nr:UNKNOWN [Stylonychia lemnae]|eukprot:CDW91017.1 UNKNOWN [Stylonychia lemnae]